MGSGTLPNITPYIFFVLFCLASLPHPNLMDLTFPLIPIDVYLLLDLSTCWGCNAKVLLTVRVVQILTVMFCSLNSLIGIRKEVYIVLKANVNLLC